MALGMNEDLPAAPNNITEYVESGYPEQARAGCDVTTSTQSLHLLGYPPPPRPPAPYRSH
ncbi:hypothetical protein E2C01_034813 [Portunus trituberculatus]|uniref:Uncharacterized protein n=1 Tax=Portunus trituberculatus TaxID=210409 RepID=A0A5B7F7C4_PORTR|nr:hypothetical protein [Portunus trituberculatus]